MTTGCEEFAATLCRYDQKIEAVNAIIAIAPAARKGSRQDSTPRAGVTEIANGAVIAGGMGIAGGAVMAGCAVTGGGIGDRSATRSAARSTIAARSVPS